jgi:hypothetical protein
LNPVTLWIAKQVIFSLAKEVVKKAINTLWPSLFGENRIVQPKPIGTSGKVPKGDPYSLAFSIMAEGNDGLRFKLLFRDDISAAIFNRQIAAFFAFLSQYYGGQLDVGTQAQMTKARIIGRTILVAYDDANECFVFPDPVPQSRPD